MTITESQIFERCKIGELDLANRIAVAPMTRTSARADGSVGPLMQSYYEAFGRGGFGLIVTEGTYTDQRYSQGYRNQPGIATEQQASSWKPVVNAVRATGARFIMQLMHAGALSQYNAHIDHPAGPSAIQPKGEQMSFYGGEGPYRMPRALSIREIDEAISGFAASASRARAAGFDGVEIHGANGYLLDQFITSYSNARTDHYGGSLENRLRLPCEVVRAVRAAVGSDFVVGIRISQRKVNDFEHKWEEGERAAQTIFGNLSQMGVDYIHTTELEADQPAFGVGAPLCALARRFSGLPVMANGSLHDPRRAARLIDEDSATLLSIGRGSLANSDWPNRVSQGQPLHDFDFAMLLPLATLDNAARVARSRE